MVAHVEEQFAEYPEPGRNAALTRLFDYYLHIAPTLLISGDPRSHVSPHARDGPGDQGFG
jgi:hypothetical protein